MAEKPSHASAVAPTVSSTSATTPPDSHSKIPGLVLGTAGHIDHGKTSLVKALTGRDLDRLPEEKARGITIELGFTPLDLDDGTRVALVDVPGHEKFVRTMVSGASGIDLLLLVVAADEGVMPQTREHLAICGLLGITRGLVVLTKCDLVDDEMLELATEDVRDALAEGPLADLTILPASATTGEGIDALRDALRALIEQMPARGRDDRPSRLPIDRTFTKHGFGSVVTGTWSGRSVRIGESIVLEPGERKAKVRGLEQHGEAVDAAQSGTRVAVNLQGIAHHEIHRGDLLTVPGTLLSTSVFDAQVQWLARKTELAEPTSVELLVGTSERRARIAPIGEAPISAGASGFARLHVEGDAISLLPGDRFVFRGFARDAGVGSTLGGGIVLDVTPPHRRRRDAGLLEDLRRLAVAAPSTTAGSPADPSESKDARRERESEGLVVRIDRAGLRGIDESRLCLETGLGRTQVHEWITELARRETIAALDGGLCLANAAAERLMSEMLVALDRFHAAEPLQPGMPRATLVGVLPTNAAPGAGGTLLARLVERGDVSIQNEIVTRIGFTSSLSDAEAKLAESLRGRYAKAGLDAPAMRTLADEIHENEKTLRALAHYLERQGELVAAPDDLFFDRGAVRTLIGQVVAHFDASDELDTQTLKAMIGTSRRTAIPLMALLDDMQITRRDGSVRRLIGGAPLHW